MKMPCGCCEGTEVQTPMTTANRPGLPALSYRVGTHATFLETMKARLSSADFPELARLKTRAANDPAIAFLDSWALVADVLTFYQERIANEGYLRTATERRSILELARLIGYVLRPGVAATVYLAYTLDEDRSATPPKPTAVTIPAGARAQSLPGPGELPQSFETSDDLEARSQWTILKPRLSKPQTEASIWNPAANDSEMIGPRVYLKGIATNLKQNDPLLIDFGMGKPELFRVIELEPDAPADRTKVALRPWVTLEQAITAVGESARRFRAVAEFDVDPSTAMAGRVLPYLEKLETQASTGSATEVMDLLQRSILPSLVEEHRLAKENQFTKLEPWLGEMIEALETVLGNLNISVSREAAVTAAARFGLGADGAVKPGGTEGIPSVTTMLKVLQASPSIPPRNALRLERSVNQTFAARADVFPRMLTALNPMLQPVLYTALKNAKVTPVSGIKVYALRVTAPLFGHNAPKKPTELDENKVMHTEEWDANDIKAAEVPGAVYLDASYDKILPDSWIVVDTSAFDKSKSERVQPAEFPILVAKTNNPSPGISRAEYGMSGSTTRIELVDSTSVKPKTWIVFRDSSEVRGAAAGVRDEFQIVRKTRVYTQSEELKLADEPIDAPIGGCDPDDAEAGREIELDELYDSLDSGRWLIVSGERLIDGTTGVNASELVMLAGVEQRFNAKLPGDKTHTFIQLTASLAYCYKRDTVAIYGNVVKATHGETRNEVLGSGDGSMALQQFTLRQPPLTFVSAPNPSGVESTLQVRVNDVLWHETDSLAGLMPTDRKFITRTDDDGKTTVIFGNGQEGVRLPTGQENVKAVYRNGIGKPGNVKAGQITLLATRPLGVKAVTNPLRASGGADKESRDQARENAPLAVMALDRLVSTQDYADFARTFAGIGKASAVRLSDGRRQLVHVTIAGADDIAIEKTSDLYRNLVQALHDFGDPYLPIQVDVRELLALIISANVRVFPDYQWETVEPKIRGALLDKFGFQRQELGQPVFLSEIVSVIQRVAGIAYVDVDVLNTISEAELFAPELLKQKLKELTATTKPEPYVDVRLAETVAQAGKGRSPSTAVKGIYPAQLAFVTPNVPATLILNEVTR